MATPAILFTDAGGVAHEIRCEVIVGADGSHSMCRQQLPETQRRTFSKEYPFAWFGFLVEAPPSAAELVYTHSDQGFALVSQRTSSMQRMYFQCDPDEDVAAWSDDRIWSEIQGRVAGPDGFVLQEGPISDQTVLRFRSFVCEPMRYGNLLLAGDAAHTVPPTGAKGLNLALADVRILAACLERALVDDEPASPRPVRTPGTGSSLALTALLLLDDPDAARPPGRRPLRPSPSGGRAAQRRRFHGRRHLLGRRATRAGRRADRAAVRTGTPFGRAASPNARTLSAATRYTHAPPSVLPPELLSSTNSAPRTANLQSSPYLANQASASARSASPSVTRIAVPSRTTSFPLAQPFAPMPPVVTATRGLASRLCDFCSSGPVQKAKAPSCHTPTSGTAWGRPSTRTVTIQ